MTHLNSILILSILLLAGCSSDKSKTGDKGKHGDDNEEAPHGGVLFSDPKHTHHLELVTEKGKSALLYVAGKDPTKQIGFTKKDMTFTMTVKGSADAKVEFKPDRQPSDPADGFSRFKAAGDLPEKLDMEKVEFSGEINGKPYIFTLDKD